MSAAHVRRGGGNTRAKPRKSSKVAVPKRIAKRLPVNQARPTGSRPGLAAFMLAITLVVIVALDIPAKAERAAGTATGERFTSPATRSSDQPYGSVAGSTAS